MHFMRAGLFVSLAVIMLWPMKPAAGQLIGPTPYLSFNDSPFKGLSFSKFFLEDFEDGLFNVPGVTGISNTPGTSLGVGGNHPFSDSVDGDDGAIDGSGTGGQALAEALNQTTDDLGYDFVFNAAVLGGLPTHVGIVWTDGSPSAPTQFEAYGPGNTLIGIVGPVDISDNSFAGETAEDRFFGVINAAGVERIVIRDPGGVNNLTVDHLQYGIAGASAVPEPGTYSLLGGLLVPGAACLVRRSRAVRSKRD